MHKPLILLPTISIFTVSICPFSPTNEQYSLSITFDFVISARDMRL